MNVCSPRFPIALIVLGAFATSASLLANERRLEVLPESVELRGSAARQQILVTEYLGDAAVGSLDEGVAIGSLNPEIARVENGVIVPVSNGQTRIVAIHEGRGASIEVTVRDVEKPSARSFRHHVQSVLAKGSCNSGSCHGAVAGQNGFRLSLRGYDSEGDYLEIARAARGRRIVPSDPGRSLLLLKPTGVLPHKGGTRFDTNSIEYRVLSEWIARGAPPPREDDIRIERIEVLPSASVLAKGETQRLIVRAWFDDGHSEDVTHWAKYTSTNATVADVDESGLVTVRGYGEGAVTVWYQSRLVVASITAPFENEIPEDAFAKTPSRNFIDEIVIDKLRDLRLAPSSLASDAEFLRRAHLDTIGRLPTAEETRAFLASDDQDKRDRKIEELLERPEFVDYWAYKWSDLLLVNGKKLPAKALWSYYSWIRNNVAADTPWDEFARQIVTARGSTLENGAANFYVLHRDPQGMAETTSIAFLGTSIACAKCHNHPLEKWTNDQYYAMANLFARVRTKSTKSRDNLIVFDATAGDLIQPLTGRARPPEPLDGEALSLDSSTDRRAHLAAWLTSPENPYFARAIANRVWANFLGVGLVEKVDDLRQSNPASNEKLLGALAAHLSEKRYDLKSLMRAILRSTTYQRSSRALETNRGDSRFYSRFFPRRLKADVLLDAVSDVTGSPRSAQKSLRAGSGRDCSLPNKLAAMLFSAIAPLPPRGVVPVQTGLPRAFEWY